MAGLLLALVLRIALIATHAYPLAQTRDPHDYQRIATSIATGRGYPASIYAPGGGPSAFRAPGYPYFLAAIYAVFGIKVIVARVVQALLGTIVVALIGLIARCLFGRRAGIVALWLAAIYPPLVLASSALISENVFLPLELGAVALALDAWRARAPGLRHAVWLGVLVGLAILTRNAAIPLVVPAVLALLGRRPWRGWHVARAPAVMLLVTAITVSPWVIRNVTVMHKLVLSTETGYYLAETYNDASLRDSTVPAATRIPSAVPQFRPFLLHGHMTETAVEARLMHDALVFVRHHPAYVGKAFLYNTLRMFDLSGGLALSQRVYANLGIGPTSADAAIFSFYVLGLLSLVGLLARRSRRVPLFVWLTPILLLLAPAFIQGTSRYRLPLEPFIVIFAAVALVSGGEWASRGFSRRWEGWSAARSDREPRAMSVDGI